MKKDEEEKEEIEDEEPDLEEEESELEEEVLDTSNVDFSQIQNISFDDFSTGAPVLNQVAVAQNVIGLEHGIDTSPMHSPLKEDNSDPFKYNAGGDKDDPTKYVSSDAQIRSAPERVESSTYGREDPFAANQRIHQNQSGFFTSTHQSANQDDSLEKYVMPENQNIDSVGRQNHFKPPEMKYDPKLPKH